MRDALLGRPIEEADVVVVGDAEPFARAMAEHAGGFVFPLSERFGAWRVIARDRTWQSDITPARGTIEEDLGLRDFTVNAMAVPADEPGRLIDPHGGEADLGARRIRAVGARSFADDPLRVLRMARFAVDLDFEVDPGTTAPRGRGVRADRRRRAPSARSTSCGAWSPARRRGAGST